MLPKIDLKNHLVIVTQFDGDRYDFDGDGLREQAGKEMPLVVVVVRAFIKLSKYILLSYKMPYFSSHAFCASITAIFNVFDDFLLKCLSK